ncbi:amidohydrolase [Natronosporangium hydrolyticum]|uniref:Amidohydrolase n=2 Tax=Natronosporangium hydrolyticum TaxID=2811111 RepID=A0A895YQF1_9ACTN|nr:amidohydrolase [Natronosporangium hydrolyticum]
MADELAALRRRLHQIPEIGLHLPRTQEAVLAALDGLPLEITLGEQLSSVTAVLRGGTPGGPAVLLRGDMDALPVTERTGEPFSSEHEGAMHACGHDLHTAGLVGAARLLAARREQLAGDVVFMFQPGEEGHDGARYMVEEGVLTAAGPEVSAAYGIHVSSSMYHKGVFVGRPGTLMAASAGLSVRVIGAGGHGSTPHRTLDPVPAACEMVLGLQSMVTRRFDVFEPVVVTVGSFHAGTKRNIIPDDATFEATVRAFSPEPLARVREYAVQLCEQIAAAHGLRAEATFHEEYPATVNDATEHAFVAQTIQELFGEQRYEELANPMTGSEDFSRVLDRVPGAYVFLGATCADDDPAAAPTNHSPLARFDDSVLSDGAALLAELATRRLTAT